MTGIWNRAVEEQFPQPIAAAEEAQVAPGQAAPAPQPGPAQTSQNEAQSAELEVNYLFMFWVWLVLIWEYVSTVRYAVAFVT